LLTALGIEPEVCHLNEGHAALAVLERARNFMQVSGESFEVALGVTRAGNLFTTHTAVAAAFDRFPAVLVGHCLGDYAREALGITLQDLLALGRRNPLDATEDFNMAYLGIRGSGGVNGVSQLHGKVSRRLFRPLFPRWPEDEVPVGHVTNGVHMPSWDSAPADAVWTRAAGKGRWSGNIEALEQGMMKISDAELWNFRNISRRALVDFARERLSLDLAASEALPAEAAAARQILDPQALTLGFARRFAGYKRPTLLLHDSQRLLRLLRNSTHPVQLIIAGKAHPADREGQDLIQQWSDFIRQSAARAHVVFLRDYDMQITERMVQGVDVWLNTPRRPWEACGTSGMKVLVNGGINLSERDGWWAEAYSPEAGWALGDGAEHGDDPAYDAAEAGVLYDLLEQQVIPEFYRRDEAGIPTAWVARMRNSMAQLTPRFSTNRSLREYTEEHYLPAAATYRERAANGGAEGAKIIRWRQALSQHWGEWRSHFRERRRAARLQGGGVPGRARSRRRAAGAVRGRRPRSRFLAPRHGAHRVTGGRERNIRVWRAGARRPAGKPLHRADRGSSSGCQCSSRSRVRAVAAMNPEIDNPRWFPTGSREPWTLVMASRHRPCARDRCRDP
jgi:starch phosphorylase